MKTTRFFFPMLAALMLTALPFSTALAEETTDSTTHKKNVVVLTKGSKGRPITSKEKDIAKEMAKKGGQMGSQGVKLAITALTNPSKADSLGKELEKMGDEMERLGDSLESLSEDTTFFYEGEEEDTILLSDDDFDEIAEEFTRNFNFKWPGLFGGILGIMGGILGILIAIFVVLLLFGIFTAPLWIIALIIWLIVRNNRRNAAPQVAQTTSTGAPLSAGQAAQATGQTAQPQTAAPLVSTPQGLSDENQEMWKSGIMYACVGVGLIALFLSVGFEDFWGIGALVVCVGVAKLIIATTTKGKGNKNDATTTTSSDISADSNYEK